MKLREYRGWTYTIIARENDFLAEAFQDGCAPKSGIGDTEEEAVFDLEDVIDEWEEMYGGMVF